MLNNDLKKEALANYEKALSSFNNLLPQLKSSSDKLRNCQEVSIDLINHICDLINSICNSPKEMRTDIFTVTSNISTYKKTEEYKDQAFEGYLDATGDLLKGAGRGWVYIGSGERFDHWFGWAIVAFHTALSVLKIKATNTKIANEAFKVTQEIRKKETELSKYIAQIDAKTSMIETLYNGLNSEVDRLGLYRNCDYRSLDIQIRKFLGSIVNKTLTLSEAISKAITYSEEEQ